MPGEPIERLSARVSPEAKRGWLTFCHRQGVTFTAMVEASGLMLDAAQGGLLPDNADVVELARSIAFQRAKRR